MKNEWLNFIESNSCGDRDQVISGIYKAMLVWIVYTEYRGGCHDTSAALYMLMAESGIESKICLGEVKTGENYFDHSWVEVDGEIYDAAICMPLLGGKYHPPVFKSYDLESGEITGLGYGVSSPFGFDEVTCWIAQASLEEYTLGDPAGEDKLWNLTKTVGHHLGMTLDPEALKEKYKDVRREIRGNSL